MPYQEFTTVPAQIDADLSDFPLYLNFADFDKAGNDIFDGATASGGDIRAYDTNGTTDLAREIVSFDTTAKTGEGYVNIPALSSSVAQTRRVSYDGVSSEPTADSAYGSENAWNSDYTLVYHMNDATTSTVTDSTSNSNDGTKSSANNPLELDGKIGKAQDFSGDVITVTASTALRDLPTTYDFTVSFWSNVDVVDNDIAALSWSGTDDLVIYPNDDINGSGGGRVFWRDLGGQLISEAGTDIKGAYHLNHFISRASNGHELYRDAGSIGTSSGTGAAGPFSDLYIGQFPAQPFDGKIDEVRIMSTAVSDDWITTEYNNQNSPSTFYSVSDEINKVATPVILPVSGAYPASQSISMSCATSGASIYYTEDGSTPDSGDSLYSAPFTLGSAKTVKAIGIKAGLTDSDVATNTYTIATIAPQPIITIMT